MTYLDGNGCRERIQGQRSEMHAVRDVPDMMHEHRHVRAQTGYVGRRRPRRGGQSHFNVPCHHPLV